MTCRESLALDLADFLARATAPEFVAFRTQRTRESTAAYSRQMASVPSVDALSATISSKSVKVWARMESIVVRR